MSVLSQQVSANNNLYYFLRASVSSLNVNGISTGTLTADKVIANIGVLSTLSAPTVQVIDGLFSTLSTGYADIYDLNTSSIFGNTLVLDNQTLTANPTSLLLNGIPIATQSSLSSIADWALDPAISTVNLAGNNLVSANTIYAGSGMFSNLMALNIFALSTYTSTISSLAEVADFGFFNTLSTGNASFGSLSSIVASFSSCEISSFNGNAAAFSTLISPLISTSELYASSAVVSVLSASTCSVSSLTADSVSTTELFVSSINGSEFTPSSILVSSIATESVSTVFLQASTLAGSLVSTLGADIKQGLMSSIVFSPSLNPSLGGVNVNLGLGGILGNVIGWGAGVMGAGTGVVALGTSMFALANGRQTDYIDNTKYEVVNGTSQLQFSTLGESFSTIYRFNQSVDAERVPGEEVFISTISPPGVAMRTMSDPIYTLSTPSSTIQAFSQWVPVPEALINSSTFSTLAVADLTANRITTSSISGGESGLLSINSPLMYFSTGGAPGNLVVFDSEVDAPRFESAEVYTSSIACSTITASTIYMPASGYLEVPTIGASYISSQSLVFQIDTKGGMYFSAGDMNLIASTVRIGNNIGSQSIFFASTISTNQEVANTVVANAATVSSLTFTGASTIVFSTAATAASAGQPIGRLLMIGNDLDLGQNQLWARQIRIGGGSAVAATPELVFYGPDNTTKALQVGNADWTIRIQSTIGSAQAGYILDTQVNRPFFSTINNQVNLMAYFPSTNSSTIGVSSMTKMNPVTLYGRSTLAGGTVTVVFSPPYADSNEYSVNLTYRNSAGGSPLHANILSVSSFSANGSATNDFFWQTVGRV
jgi:hypothetical protein